MRISAKNRVNFGDVGGMASEGGFGRSSGGVGGGGRAGGGFSILFRVVSAGVININIKI